MPEDINRNLGEATGRLEAKNKECEALTQRVAILEKDLAEARAALDAAKAEGTKAAGEFAAYKEKSALALLTTRVDGLVAAGKISPAEKPQVQKTAEALAKVSATGPMNFSDGTEGNPLDDFFKGLEARPKSQLLREFGAPESGQEMATPTAGPTPTRKL